MSKAYLFSLAMRGQHAMHAPTHNHPFSMGVSMRVTGVEDNPQTTSSLEPELPWNPLDVDRVGGCGLTMDASIRRDKWKASIRRDSVRS